MLGGTGRDGLLVEALQLLFLPYIGREGDDVGIISFFEPFNDDGGVETTLVSENDFHKLDPSLGYRPKTAQSKNRHREDDARPPRFTVL